MPADRVVVIDVGTSAIRAVAVTADGATERLAEVELPIVRPVDAGEFAREIPSLVVTQFEEMIGQAALRCPRPAALAFTGQREGLACVDAEGVAVMLSPNIDARAATEGMRFDAEQAPTIYETTGRLPSLLLAQAKLAWLHAWRPDAARRVHAVLPLTDWLGSVLTGEIAASRGLLCEVGLVDVRSGEPSLELSRRLVGDDLAAMLHRAPVVDPVSMAEVKRGPFAGTPVVLCGGDTQCGVIGTGTTTPGACAAVAGWSAPLQLVTDRAVLDERRRTWTGLHAMPGVWVLESSAGDTGRAWDDVRGLCSMNAAEADAAASSVPAGSGDAMMVLGRAPMNAAAMTAGVGALTFPLPLAMWRLSRAAVLRAALEAAAYAIRANLEQLEEISGSRIDALRLGGGMSRSALFPQIVADVINRTVEVAGSADTTAAGAAALAYVASGVHASLDDALTAMASPRRCIMPRAGDSATYDDCYARWQVLMAHMEQSP